MNTKKLAASVAARIPAPIVVYAAFEFGLRAMLRREFPKLKGLHQTIQFRMTDLPGGSWFLVVDDGKATVHRGAAPYPTAIMSMKARTFRDMTTGRTDPVKATLKGDIHATGTLDQYRVLEAIFGKKRS